MFVIVFKLAQQSTSKRKVKGPEKYSINILRMLHRVMRWNKVSHYANIHIYIHTDICIYIYIYGSDITFNDSAVHTTCQNCILWIDSISYFYQNILRATFFLAAPKNGRIISAEISIIFSHGFISFFFRARFGGKKERELLSSASKAKKLELNHA